MLLLTKSKLTLLTLSLFSASGLFAQAKPSYQNVVTAKQKVMTVTQRVQRIIRSGGAGGGGGGDRCSQLRNYRACVINECRWEGQGHIGRCVTPGRHYRGPFGGHGENDTAALMAMQGMTIGLQNLSNDIDMATQTYYTPQFFYWKNQVCSKSGTLLFANQAAKVAAAIPPVLNVQPAEFNYIDQELVQVRQLMWCQ